MKHLQIAATLLLAVPCAAFQLQTLEDAELLASDGRRYARFGDAVAIDGEIALVGAPRTGPAQAYAGAAYVSRFGAGGWVEEQKLTGSDQYLAQFGSAVAASGGRLLVGSWGEGDDIPGHNQGAAYVFVHDGSQWIQEARLHHPGGFDFANQGRAVDLAGDLAVLGAPLEITGSGVQTGAVYLFRRSAGTWQELPGPLAASAAQGDLFGMSVASDGATIVVAAPNKQLPGGGEGAVHVFENQGGTFVETAQLRLPSDEPANYHGYGADVDVYGDTIVVGVRSYDAPFGGSGMVVIYERQAGIWVEAQRIEAGDQSLFDSFGNDLALEGETLVIGADGGESSPGVRSGTAYAYARESEGWRLDWKLVPSDFDAGDGFGKAVGISGSRALVGAYLHDDLGPSSGSAYVFPLEALPDVGLAYCAGDGSGTACPCGNESAPGSGRGCLASSGPGGRLRALGSTIPSRENLALEADGLPPYASSLLFAGTTAISAGAPFEDGLLCVGGGLTRLGTVQGGPLGQLVWPPDVLSLGAWSPGDTLHFQVWYRDIGGSPCGTGANTTGALEVLLAP